MATIIILGLRSTKLITQGYKGLQVEPVEITLQGSTGEVTLAGNAGAITLEGSTGEVTLQNN